MYFIRNLVTLTLVCLGSTLIAQQQAEPYDYEITASNGNETYVGKGKVIDKPFLAFLQDSATYSQFIFEMNRQLFDQQKTPVGWWKYFDTDGSIIMEGEYDNEGHRTGEWKWYYRNGTLFGTKYYIDGQHTGKCVYYYPNGKKSEEGTCINDLKKNRRHYDKKERLTQNDEFDETGQSIYSKLYYPNGNLMAEGRYIMTQQLNKNGMPVFVRDGECRIYNRKGKLKKRIVYQNGNVISKNKS